MVSQAVSVGKLKTVSPELYMQAERMKKRSKRRGKLSNEELLYGDIHHKPVIVLAFIAGIILFGIYIVWSLGSASAGILVVSGTISLIFIGKLGSLDLEIRFLRFVPLPDINIQVFFFTI